MIFRRIFRRRRKPGLTVFRDEFGFGFVLPAVGGGTERVYLYRSEKN